MAKTPNAWTRREWMHLTAAGTMQAAAAMGVRAQAAAPARLGVDAAFSTEALDAQMPTLLANKKSVWFPFATHEGLDARVDGWLDKVRARVRLGDECPQSRNDLCGVLDEMRLFKDGHEIAILRRAGKISAGAHAATTKTLASNATSRGRGVGVEEVSVFKTDGGDSRKQVRRCEASRYHDGVKGVASELRARRTAHRNRNVPMGT